MRKRFIIQILVPLFGAIFSCASFCSGASGANKTEDADGISRSSLTGLTKPTLPPLPDIDTSALTDIKDSLYSSNFLGFNPFDIMDSLLKFNRIPNWVAQLGNFSLLQAALLLALGGVIVGSAILVAEAWSFKNEQDQEYYFQHRIPQYFETSPINSNYGVPAAPVSPGGYNRRQFSYLPRPPQNYNSYLNGLRNQPNPPNPAKMPNDLYRYTQKDPLLFYNYANTADSTRVNNNNRNNNNNNNNNNNDRSSSIITVQDIKEPGSSSYLSFPTFDRDKKKKIMFG